MKAYGLLADESKLCRGNFAENRDKHFTNPAINEVTGRCEAVKWDIMGAIQYCYNPSEAYRLIAKGKEYILKNRQRYKGLADFSDLGKHDDILFVLREIEG